MIDIHAHVIPGVDDGPSDMDSALALLRQAVAVGVTQVVATPHFHLPSFDNYSTYSQFEALKEAAKKANIPIQLHLGNEIYADEEAAKHLAEGTIHTMATTNYILLELPITRMYPLHHDLIFNLQKQGYRVILAHIDRYSYFKEKPETLKALIDKGCLGQLSADYMIKRPRDAKKWLESGMAHFVASDMHHMERRPNRLGHAQKEIRKHLGDQWAQQLLIDNPTAMLHQREVLRLPTKPVKRSWRETIFG